MTKTNEATAQWVWADASSDVSPRRVDRVCFRRLVTLAETPVEAMLHLSARLHYHLRINGRDVGVGPARAYPEHREFDSYAVHALFVPGSNVVEVEVLHWDLTTFHNLREPPGFVAWGHVLTAGGTVHELATPGEWRCCRIEGVSADAPRLSFAQGPVEFVDLRADTRTRPAAWQPCAVPERGRAPSLSPRSIPPLTQTRLAAATVAVAPVTDDEVQIGARLAFDTPDQTTSESSRDRHAVMAAWIHSPEDQTVPLGQWWGELWVNGVLCAPRPSPDRPLRSESELELRAGWNRIVVIQGIAFGYAEFCFAWPRVAGLRVRTERAPDGPDAVLLAGPFRSADLKPHWDALTGDAGELPSLDWRRVSTNGVPSSPLRHVAWAPPSSPLAVTTLPLTIPAGTRALVTLDMGQLVLGRPSFDLEAPSGTVLDVAHGEERRGERTHVGKAVTVYGADRWILPGARQRVETFSPRGFRYLDVLVSGHGRPVTLHAAGVVEQRYPFAFTGDFACSDDAFNRLWAYGRRTLELCSEDVFTDCPWRERTLYGGDLLPEMATTAVLTRDLRLVRHSLDLFLHSFDPATGWLQARVPAPRTGAGLSDYPLLTSIAAAWYVRLTGDTAFARAAWPVCAGMVAAVERMNRPDGLYAPPSRAFIDHGRRVTAGPTCALNAALVAAFAAWADIARAVGETSAAAALERRREDLDARMVAAYFDRSEGTFRDLPLAEGGMTTEGSPPNSWPLLFCPSVRHEAPAVLHALARTLATYAPDREAESVSPYQMFYLLSALRDEGAADMAEAAIRNVYAEMLATPTGTLWEVSHPSQSLVHAWSSGCNHYFATAILGVRMGFRDAEELSRILIAPTSTLAWARGRVPHPLGDVDVEWERRADRLHVTVAAPGNVPIEVAPAGPLAGLPCQVWRR